MKTFLKQFFCLILIIASFSASAQDYQWVKGGGGSDAVSVGSSEKNEGSYFVCTDQNRNIYSINIVGNSAMTADTFHASSALGAPNNILITSYTCTGQMRWAKLIASSLSDVFPLGLTVDRAGHVYIAGIFPHGNLKIGYDTTITANYQVAATMQFDTNGHFNWLRWVGPSTVANRTASMPGYGGIALDRQQNLHFIKMYKPGSQITPTLLTSYGTYDLMYDLSGNLISVTRLQLDSTLALKGVSIDTSNNKLYVYGENNYGLSPTGSYPGFIAKFDVNRNAIWQDTVQSPLFASSGAIANFGSITNDCQGNIYVTGVGSGSAAFGGDTITDAPYFSGQVAFMAKVDTFGNAKWIKPFAGSLSTNYLAAICLMPNGKIAAMGAMVGTVIRGTDTIVGYSGEGVNSYFAVLDTSGNVQTLQQIHSGGNDDGGYSIAADKVGNLYLGGAGGPTIWGGSISPYTSIGGNTDFFVMKYGVDCNCTAMPVASFTYAGSPTVIFTYTGTTAGIDSVRWYFGDGSTSTVFSPTHAYTTGGTFHVRVKIYSACGGDTRFATIVIPCVSAPASAFTSSGVTATRNFSYSGATADSVVWHFGDGGHATGLTASHIYATTGTFNACALAYNLCGVDSVCHPITVSCVVAPVANFTDTGTYVKGYIYTGSTTALDSVSWNYGDGGHGIGSSVTHVYSSPGSYNVCVTAYSQCGSNTVCHTVVISCPGTPVSAFTYTGTSVIHATYTGTTTYMDSVTWDFGDGAHGAGLTATHSYAVPDTFHICATVYTDCGVDSSCTDLIIPCIITPSFTDTGTKTVGFFYNGSTANLDSVVWNFGDGATDTGFYTSHTYLSSDTFHVCEYTYTSCGVDSMCRDVIVVGLAVNDVNGIFDNINVYPNPATNEMHITGITRLTNYRLLTVMGENLQQGVLQKEHNTIEIKDYASGVYMVELVADNGSRKTFRVIKE